MKQNVGILDTAIRATISCIILALVFENMFGPIVNGLLIAVGCATFFTSAFGFCPLYKLLNIDTYPDFRDDSFHVH
jgi:hypothetical protein